MPLKVKWTIAFAIGAGLVWLGWLVPMFLSVFHVLLCLVLVLIILMQSGSAADLAGAFGGAGSQTAFGPRSAATFLTKATVWCAAIFMLSSLALSLRQPRPGVSSGNTVLPQTSQSTSQPAKSAPVRIPASPPPSAPIHLPASTPASTPKLPAKH